jgi:predicted aspartyl protease
MIMLTDGNPVDAANPITAAEVVQKVRQAVGFDSLRRQAGGLLAEGTAEHLGIEGNFHLLISPSGGFLQTIQAHGTHVLGFNGRVAWEQAFSRKPKILDFGESETLQSFAAVRTHHWLADDSPYKVSLVENGLKDGELAVQLSKPGDLTPTQIMLDRNTWLPLRMSRAWLFGDVVCEFSDYAEFLGTKWPRKTLLREGMAEHQYKVKTVRLAPSANPKDFTPHGEGSPLVWEAQQPSRVELKRTPSGHFFAKAKINGQDVGWFAVDTGTGTNMTVSRKVADQLHLPAFGKTFAGGAGHQNPTHFRETESIQVGPATMKNAVCFEMPPEFTDAMAKMFGFEWAGTIGHDFLSQVVSELDLKANTLDLFDPANYQLKHGEWQQLRLNYGIPCLQCKVENQYDGWFQFDTGAGSVAIIHAPAVERHQMLKERETRHYPLPGVGGTIDAQMGRLKEFAVGGQTISNVLTFFVTGKQGALIDPYTMGTFGAGILNGDTLILDYGHRRAALVKKQ